VFQYSTSFTAAQYIVARILEGDKKMVEKYLKFLGSGCSEYPIPTLRELGIDMLGDEPFERTMKRMEAIMDQIESL
jgi:oligoendopeptidase F